MGGGRDAKNGETLESGSQEVICQAEKYQHSGARGTRSPPATPYHLQHLTTLWIQNGRQDLDKGQTLGYWTPWSTFAKWVFDLIILSIRTSKI